MTKIKNNSLILIPVFNEGKSVEKLAPYIQNIKKNNYKFVNDGSYDDTLDVLKKMNFEYIHLKKNLGKGNAISKGIDFAKKENNKWIITMDGDLQHPPELISKFDDEDKIEIKLGWRKNKTTMPLFRKLSNIITSLFLSIRSNTLIRDSQCGYRGFPLELYIKCQNKEMGFHMESEFLIKSCILGTPINHIEIPTIYNDSESSMNYIPDMMKFIALWFRSFIW